MATKYLLQCDCGERIAVSASQAGDAVVCRLCRESQEVPSLRDLRDLPTLEDGANQGSEWGFGQGVLAAGAVVVAALLLGAAWFRVTQPAPPGPFDGVARTAVVDQSIDALNPNQAWVVWEASYKPMAVRGLQTLTAAEDLRATQQIAASETATRRLLIAAGVFLALTLVVYAAAPR